jgi:hypothetical protein
MLPLADEPVMPFTDVERLRLLLVACRRLGLAEALRPELRAAAEALERNEEEEAARLFKLAWPPLSREERAALAGVDSSSGCLTADEREILISVLGPRLFGIHPDDGEPGPDPWPEPLPVGPDGGVSEFVLP